MPETIDRDIIAGMTEIAELLELTPELAEHLLGAAGRNRRLNPPTVNRYAEAMRRGEWRLSSDAIAVNGDGTLLNGQHRCAAVVQSGIAVRVLFVRGMSSETQLVLDSGRRRSVADNLSMLGEKSSISLAAALGWFYRYNAGLMRSSGTWSLTTPHALELLAEHPGIRTTVAQANRGGRTIPVAPGLWGALLYLFASIDFTDAEVFWSSLMSGANLAETDPRFRLRQALIGEIGSSRKTPTWRIAALAIKAWNAWRDGEPVRQLSFRAGGANAEAFPEIH